MEEGKTLFYDMIENDEMLNRIKEEEKTFYGGLERDVLKQIKMDKGYFFICDNDNTRWFKINSIK